MLLMLLLLLVYRRELYHRKNINLIVDVIYCEFSFFAIVNICRENIDFSFDFSKVLEIVFPSTRNAYDMTPSLIRRVDVMWLWIWIIFLFFLHTRYTKTLSWWNESEPSSVIWKIANIWRRNLERIMKPVHKKYCFQTNSTETETQTTINQVE